MENFAQYILSEKDLIAKMEIEYYLSKKHEVFFDKSVVFKTEIVRLFLNFMEIEVDRNIALTACLLYNCKKINKPHEVGKVKTYVKEGAEFLRSIGFEERVCKICEEANRYGESIEREKESDILELADQYGGMVLNREERIGFKPDEALVLLEHRNLKDKYNRYLENFIAFIKELEQIEMGEIKKEGALSKLIQTCNNSEGVKEFIKNLAYTYEPEIDRKLKIRREQPTIIENENNPNRALFSEETTRKIIGHIPDRT